MRIVAFTYHGVMRIKFAVVFDVKWVTNILSYSNSLLRQKNTRNNIIRRIYVRIPTSTNNWVIFRGPEFTTVHAGTELSNDNGDGDGNENVTNLHILWAKT